MDTDVERRKTVDFQLSITNRMARLAHTIGLEWCRRSQIEVLGQEVPAQTQDAESIVDIVGRAQDGSLQIVETKWGIHRSKRAQRKVLHAFQREGVSVAREFIRNANVQATADGVIQGSSVVLNVVTHEDLDRIIVAAEAAQSITYPTTSELHLPRVPVSIYEFFKDARVLALIKTVQRGISRSVIEADQGTSVKIVRGTSNSVFSYTNSAGQPSALESALDTSLFLEPDQLLQVEQAFGPVRRILWSTTDPNRTL